MIRLTPESEGKITDYIQRGFLPYELYNLLFLTESKLDYVNALKRYLSLDDIVLPKFWTYIINVVCDSINNSLCKNEFYLLKQIVPGLSF